MKSYSAGFFSAVVAFILYTCGLQVASAASIDADPPELPHQVLVLNSHSVGIPWATLLNQSIIKTFREDILSDKVQLHIEYTGLSQHLDTTYQERLIDLYQHKYHDRPLALILAADVPAIEFLKAHRHRLFPGVPVVFTADSQHTLQNGSSENIIGISTHLNITRNIETILQLHPKTRQFAVIGGADPTGRNLAAMVHQALASYSDRYATIDLVGLPIAELLDRVAHLPEHTVVFYSLILVDGDGQRFIPREILAHLSQVASVPMYSFWDTLLGFGVVGGYVSDTQTLGQQMASVGQKILAGTPPQAIQVDQDSLAFHFDWEQLQRWNISPRQLPQGSILHNQPITAWQLYRLEISVALAIMGVLLVAVIILLFIRRHLRIQVAQRTQTLIQTNAELEQANAQLSALSQTDGLTGIANRRHFDEVLEIEYNRAQRAAQPIALGMMDIDWFKLYNDHYGHQGGDTCLRSVAKTLAEVISRAGDVVARYGGEEFIFIAPNTDNANALAMAEKICTAIAALVLPHEHSPFGHVTISIGVATMIPTNDSASNTLLQNADKALYTAKKKGRNQAVLASAVGVCAIGDTAAPAPRAQ